MGWGRAIIGLFIYIGGTIFSPCNPLCYPTLAFHKSLLAGLPPATPGHIISPQQFRSHLPELAVSVTHWNDLFRDYLPYRSASFIKEDGMFLTVSKHLRHNRSSINICPINEWIYRISLQLSSSNSFLLNLNFRSLKWQGILKYLSNVHLAKFLKSENLYIQIKWIAIFGILWWMNYYFKTSRVNVYWMTLLKAKKERQPVFKK